MSDVTIFGFEWVTFLLGYYTTFMLDINLNIDRFLIILQNILERFSEIFKMTTFV